MSTQSLIFSLLGAASALTRKLDRALSSIKGISFSEYQLLASLRDEPGSSATRVDLAQLVGLTPSGVTRALKPLEKLGFVETVKDGRDARRSLATLTSAGLELVEDADGVVGDTLANIDVLDSLSSDEQQRFIDVMRSLPHA